MEPVIDHEQQDGFGRDLHSLYVPELRVIPGLGFPNLHFACLVACNFEVQPVALLKSFAGHLIDAGAVYVCAWGPGCTDFDDVVDHVAVERDLEDERESPVIMTTWHDHDSLDEVLCFLMLSAVPDDAWIETCRKAVVIVVGDRAWKRQVERRLSDPKRLDREVCQGCGLGRLAG